MGTLSDFTYIGSMADQGTSLATSLGTTITAGAANTKGAYTQITAATLIQTDHLLIGICNFPGTGNNQAVDIAVGPLGSEQVILSNLVLSSNVNNTCEYNLPFSMPAGTRLSARCQAVTAGDKVAVNIQLGGGSFEFRSFNTCDTYGYNTATSLGTAIDPGAVANTKGAYAQITASTNRDHYGLIIAIDQHNNSAGATQNWLMDIAIGLSGSETIVIPNLTCAGTSSAIDILPMVRGIIPLQIPAGTRIAVRSQCSSTAAATRIFGATIYGLS